MMGVNLGWEACGAIPVMRSATHAVHGIAESHAVVEPSWPPRLSALESNYLGPWTLLPCAWAWKLSNFLSVLLVAGIPLPGTSTIAELVDLGILSNLLRPVHHDRAA